MNNSFNYSGFIELFLNSNDDFEPYGFADNLPPGVDPQSAQSHQRQHREKLITKPEDD